MSILKLTEEQIKQLKGVETVVVTATKDNTLYAANGTTIIKVLVPKEQVGNYSMGNTLKVKDGLLLSGKDAKPAPVKSNSNTVRAGAWLY